MGGPDGERREVPLGLWVIYVVALFGGPILWIAILIHATGLFGQYEASPLEVAPAWLALSVAPLIGIVVGWRLPLVAGSRARVLLGTATVLTLLAVAAMLSPLAFGQGWSGPAVVVAFGLYAVAPVLVGRSLLLAVAVLGPGSRRRRPR